MIVGRLPGVIHRPAPVRRDHPSEERSALAEARRVPSRIESARAVRSPNR